MQVTQDIAIERIAVAPDTAPTARLVVRGKPTDTIVAGAILEAAVSTGSGYVLCLTDDVPFEDQLHIHLLDRDLQLLDSATLGWIYSTGSFRDLNIESETELSFHFFGDTQWRVKLLARPGMRLPFVSEPRGVSRKLGLTRHFIVEGNPKPDAESG